MGQGHKMRCKPTSKITDEGKRSRCRPGGHARHLPQLPPLVPTGSLCAQEPQHTDFASVSWGDRWVLGGMGL
jgi:hypothetical protein